MQLKGCTGKEVDREVNDMIKVLGLEHKTNAQSQFLSGGQKRKLSVGIALIAGSKVRRELSIVCSVFLISQLGT